MVVFLSRYLNKLYSSRLPSARLPANVCYLATDYPTHVSCGVHSAHQLEDPHTQLEAYRQCAHRYSGTVGTVDTF